MISPSILHPISVFIAIVLSAVGSGIGQGIAGSGALKALSRQSMSSNAISRALILGLALIETGAILALVIALILLFGPSEQLTWGMGYARIGMGLAIGISAAAMSIASSFAVKSSCQSIARQPFFAQKILTLMLLSQSIIEAPAIFAFIIALLINTKISPDLSLFHGLKLLAAGAAIGIGSIGPSIGQAIFAHSSCSAVGLNQKSFGKLFTFSLLSQAVIETPLIFCLIISIMLIFKPISQINPLLSLISCISATFAISIGTAGTAIAAGFTASKMSTYIALNQRHYSLYLRATLLAQAIIESAAIYALIVALMLLTKRVV